MLYGNAKLFGSQIIAVLATLVLAVAVTSLIMYLLKFTIGLRSSKAHTSGIDDIEHGERAYALTSPNQSN